MRVKHLDELYTWKQIRKLQMIHEFNQHNGFVPVAIVAPGGGRESHFCGEDDHYEWHGKQSPYYAKRLWEVARRRLADMEAEALAFDIVEASECFNTIRFKNPARVREYCAEFKRLMRKFADDGEVACAIGRAPARCHPWDTAKRLEEVIIPDDAEYEQNVGHAPDTLPDYHETPPLGWRTVERFFVTLTEDELAFLNGGDILNKSPTPLDEELIAACERLDVAKVKSALERGANPNATGGGPYAEGLISRVFEVIRGSAKQDAALKAVGEIVDLLLAHGCDIDFCPYCEGTPLYSATYHTTELIKLILERGADPNAVSWIAIGEDPATPLDSVADDINAYGHYADLLESFGAIEKAGGKFFFELVPDFYDE